MVNERYADFSTIALAAKAAASQFSPLFPALNAA